MDATQVVPPVLGNPLQEENDGDDEIQQPVLLFISFASYQSPPYPLSLLFLLSAPFLGGTL